MAEPTLPWHDFDRHPFMGQQKANKRQRTNVAITNRLQPKKSRTESYSKKPVVLPAVDKKLRDHFTWLTEKWRRHFNHKRKTPLPKRLAPMLATTLSAPFNSQDWQFEIKWDGYRCLAYLSEGKVELRSRNQLLLNQKFSQVADALYNWPVNALIDGEVVVLSPEGKADFGALQNWGEVQEGSLVYYVFDLLWLDGLDLQKEPLTMRQEVLKSLIPEGGVIRFSESIDECGVEFYQAARQNNLEGIIAKRKDAAYRSGQRSKDWCKIKVEERHEALICGYTKKSGTDRHFSSLLLCLPKGDGYDYMGAVGTGFTGKQQEAILRRLKPLTTNRSPINPLPKLNDFVQWVRPHLVCEVKYTERTKEGLMRHPSFQGLRDDKTAPDLNQVGDHEEVLPPQISRKGAKQQVLVVDGHELTLTNLQKIYWPRERITKGSLLHYYQSIADYILPYLMDRPQSLNRFPDGIKGESFYQKNMRGKAAPSWIRTFERISGSDGEGKDFLVCTGAASLLYMANLGCIEMNPWHSRVQLPNYPDWCVIDLDPGTNTFNQVIEAAQVTHQLLQALGVVSFPKTSGSTGLHIYIPLGAKYNYEQSRQLAELVATIVHSELPKTTSLLRSPSKRTDKIYLDYLQNRPIQTICAPYSVRPKPGATVSAPLHWDEVKKGLTIQRFTIKNMQERVRSEGDLFGPVLSSRIDVNSVLKTLTGLIR